MRRVLRTCNPLFVLPLVSAFSDTDRRTISGHCVCAAAHASEVDGLLASSDLRPSHHHQHGNKAAAVATTTHGHGGRRRAINF